MDFANIEQRWDVGKYEIQHFCKHFIHNVTRDMTRSMRALETELVELQSLAASTRDQGHFPSLKSKTSALTNLLGIAAEGTLVRSWFLDITQMDIQFQFFFRLEKKNGQEGLFILCCSNGSVIAGCAEIQKCKGLLQRPAPK